jgi:hypothetical protein
MQCTLKRKKKKKKHDPNPNEKAHHVCTQIANGAGWFVDEEKFSFVETDAVVE